MESLQSKTLRLIIVTAKVNSYQSDECRMIRLLYDCLGDIDDNLSVTLCSLLDRELGAGETHIMNPYKNLLVWLNSIEYNITDIDLKRHLSFIELDI